MTLKLYNYDKNFKIINKNTEPSLIASHNFEFKYYYNLVNPSVILDVKGGYKEEITPSNYCKIEDLNRYYFIKNKIYLNKDLVQLDLEEDVLTTFKNDILNSKQFISRSTELSSTLIEDNKLPFFYYRSLQEGTLESSANKFITESSELTNNIAITISYVYTTGVTPYNSDYTSDTFLLPDVSKKLIDGNYSTITYVTNESELLKFLKYLYENSDNQQYVYNIQAFPFNIDNHESTLRNIMILGTDTLAKGYILNNPSIAYDFSLLIEYPFERSHFYDYPPYTTYELYVPYYTWVELSNNNIFSDTNKIMIKYSPNLLDGSCLVTIYSFNDDLEYNYLKNATIQLGVSIPINLNNYSEVIRNNQSINLNLLTSFINAFSSGDLSNVLSTSVGGYTSSINNVIKGQTSSVSGGNLIFTPNVCRYKISKPIPTCNYDEFKKRYGIPHNDFSIIRNFQNYIEVVNPYLEGIGVFDNEDSYYSATKDEIDMIKELLVNGVYVNE